MAVEQPDRRLVDRRTQHLLGAAVMMAFFCVLVPGRKNLGTINPTRAWDGLRRHLQGNLEASGHQSETGRKNHPVINKARKIRGRGNAMDSNSLSVLSARGRSWFAPCVRAWRSGACSSRRRDRWSCRKDRINTRSICLTIWLGQFVVLQHVLDDVDAAARAVEFVAQEYEGRAGRRAEAAMDTLSKFGLGGVLDRSIASG